MATEGIQVGNLRRENSAVLVDVTLGEGYPKVEVLLARKGQPIQPGIASYDSSKYVIPQELSRQLLERVRAFVERHKNRVEALQGETSEDGA